MLGNLVKNIKTRLSGRESDFELDCSNFSGSFESQDPKRGKRSLLKKLLKNSYALISQNSTEDTYCSQNIYMLPRVLSQSTPDSSAYGSWSPIAMVPQEKPLDELDNVVDKFIRCINVSNTEDQFGYPYNNVKIKFKFLKNFI